MTTVVCVRGKTPDDFAGERDFLYVGRAVPRRGWSRSPYSNPFRVQAQRFRVVDGTCVDDAEAAVAKFREWLTRQIDRGFLDLHNLRGMRLGCWCGVWQPGQPEIACHAVVLAKMADALTD